MAADLPGIFQAFKEPDQEQSHHKIKYSGCQYHPDHVDENCVGNEKYGGYHLGKDGKADQYQSQSNTKRMESDKVRNIFNNFRDLNSFGDFYFRFGGNL